MYPGLGSRLVKESFMNSASDRRKGKGKEGKRKERNGKEEGEGGSLENILLLLLLSS